MKVLQIDALTKSFGKHAFSLDKIKLDAEKGELLALIGESGSGKTTLLRLIAGLEQADEGEIRIAGQTVVSGRKALPPEKRKIGMVFQNYALFPHLDLFDNVSYGLHRYSKEEKKRRVAEVMELVGLSGYEKRYPHELSGGQQQRVALARALAPKPGLLLLDEPFSNLDSMLKDQVREEIRQIIKKTQTTAVFVTHDIKDALSTADRIAILKDGRIQQVGTPEVLYEQPVNAYVARFFGKVNILKGKVTAEGIQTPIGLLPVAGSGMENTVTIAIRPEHLLLQAEKEGAYEARLKQQIYLGDQKELILEMATVNPPVELWAVVSNEKQFVSGDPVYFSVHKENICILEETR